MEEEEIKEEVVAPAPKKKRGKRGPKPKPKKRGPKPKSEPKPKRDKPGRPPLPAEERERRIKERERKKCEMRKEERERNSTKRFRVKTERTPARMSRFLTIPRGPQHRTLMDAKIDEWNIMRQVATGKSYAEIATMLTEANGYKIEPRTVYLTVRKAMIQWKKDNLKHVDEFIAYELGKLEQLESIVLADYEKSRVPKPQEYAALVKQGMTMEEIDAWYERKGGYPGDPAYLDKLLALQQRRLRILGLDNGNDVSQTTIVNYGFDIKDLGELSAIVGNMQDRKHDDLYEEANIVEEQNEEEPNEEEDGQGDY